MTESKPGMAVDNPRQPDKTVDPIFINRWSTRAFDTKPIPDDTLSALFEAARWAPSAFNEQPWLFVYGSQGSARQKILDLLVDANQAWAKDAPVLAVLFAKRRFARNDKPNRWAAFDSGAAWMSLAFQAHLLGLFTHGMAGFDADQSYDQLGVSKDGYDAIAVIAIGYRGDPAALPENVRAGETPNDRKPLVDVAIVAPEG